MRRAALALLFLGLLAAGLVSTPGQVRTDVSKTAAGIASRATVRPSLSGTRAAAAKTAESPLLRRMTRSGVAVRASVVTRPGVSSATTTTTPPTSSPPSSKPKSTATSSPTPSTPVTDATSTDTPDWDCLRSKESGGDYSIGGDEPYGGAYQAAVSTWQALGFSGVPNAAPPVVQDEFALKLYTWDLRYTGNPWSAWQTAPACHLW